MHAKQTFSDLHKILKNTKTPTLEVYNLVSLL